MDSSRMLMKYQSVGTVGFPMPCYTCGISSSVSPLWQGQKKGQELPEQTDICDLTCLQPFHKQLPQNESLVIISVSD